MTRRAGCDIPSSRAIAPAPAPSSASSERQRAAAAIVAGDAAAWLQQHVARLRDATPKHGNRRLHFDQLFLGLLLAFFDPLARSLRTIEDAGDFGGRLALGPPDLDRLARSTLADALAAFDPRLLRPIIEDLRWRVTPTVAADHHGHAHGHAHEDPDLAAITRRIIAADGTYLTTLAEVAWALHHTKSNGRTQGQVRANLQLDAATWAPQVLSLSGDDGLSEPAAFAPDLLAGVLYVVDRNFVEFDFLRRVLAIGSDIVQRIKANAPACRVLQSLPLAPADVAAGVVSDELIELTGPEAPGGVFRRVVIQTTNRKGEPETIRLLTNLVDAQAVPARTVGAIFRQRWQIELFFKWLKCFARMDHLLSTSRQGITTQLYVAVIAVLLMHAQIGRRRVSLYALAALGRLAHGQLTLRQAMDAIARREHERQLNAARQARRRAQKKLA